MCKESATADDVRAAMPHPAAGSAADPIALEPVDDVVVTTLVDNVYDALLTSDDSITRAALTRHSCALLRPTWRRGPRLPPQCLAATPGSGPPPGAATPGRRRTA